MRFPVRFAACWFLLANMSVEGVPEEHFSRLGKRVPQPTVAQVLGNVGLLMGGVVDTVQRPEQLGQPGVQTALGDLLAGLAQLLPAHKARSFVHDQQPLAKAQRVCFSPMAAKKLRHVDGAANPDGRIDKHRGSIPAKQTGISSLSRKRRLAAASMHKQER